MKHILCRTISNLQNILGSLQCITVECIANASPLSTEKSPILSGWKPAHTSDFHAIRSAYEKFMAQFTAILLKIFWAEVIPEIQENVRSQFSSASFEKRNDFTSMSCVGIDVNTPDQNVIAFCRAIQDIPQ